MKRLARLFDRIRTALSRYLLGVFRGTELLNRQVILDQVPGTSETSLLDCGCGDGSFTAQLAQRASAVEVFGIEWDGGRAHEASQRGVRAIQADLNATFPFADASFDVVHSNQVIEHLYATDTFLRETKRVLKPDGFVLISTNNLASWHNVISLVIGMQPPPMHVSGEVIAGNSFDPLRGSKHPTQGDSHLRILSFRAFRELMEYHGFAVEVLRGVGYYPLPPKASLVATRIDPMHGAFLVARLRKA
jgi:methionine biosynthesis protein MetW